MIKLVKKFNEKNVQTIEAYVCVCKCGCSDTACGSSPVVTKTLMANTGNTTSTPSVIYNPAPFVKIC